MSKIAYETPAKLIGKHEWRLIVIPSQKYNHKTKNMEDCRVTLYQWRVPAYLFGHHRFPAGHWQTQRDWPRYNINDGMYLGLPRGLVKLYQAHKAEIEFFLNSHDCA